MVIKILQFVIEYWNTVYSSSANSIGRNIYNMLYIVDNVREDSVQAAHKRIIGASAQSIGTYNVRYYR